MTNPKPKKLSYLELLNQFIDVKIIRDNLKKDNRDLTKQRDKLLGAVDENEKEIQRLYEVVNNLNSELVKYTKEKV
jgi:Fe2+ or Zn2+ uptake regulation protein